MATLVARLSGWQGLHLGELSVTAPPFIGFSWTPEDVIHVVPEGFALAVVASVNLLVTSRVVEHLRGRRKRLKKASADAELGAYSMANLVAGVIGAPPAVGIPARSLANVRCGGMTRLSNLFHAAFLGGFLFLSRDWIEAVPIPALAAVTAWMGICLLDWSAWRRLNLMRREDAIAFAGTALAVLLMNAVAAVALGYLVHAVGTWRTHDNRVERHPNEAAERVLASKG
jgi:SulP family sulfate permease